jgi:acetylglutamate kinase
MNSTAFNPAGIGKARILAEALPYIRAFHGKTFVIDCACRHRSGEGNWETLGRDVALLSLVGIHLLIVHRGSGHNAELVGIINRHGGRAVGLSGTDAGWVRLRTAAAAEQGGPCSDVDQVDPEIAQMYFSRGLIPVLRPLGVDADGEAAAVDASRLASAVAVALKAERLIVMVDAPGLIDGAGRLHSRLSASEAAALDGDGISATLAQALRGGVGSVHIVDARKPAVLLLETLTRESQGSVILPDEAADFVAESARYLSAQ